MPPPGRSRAASRSSAIGSPKCMKRPPLQVPTAKCPSIGLTLLRSRAVTGADAALFAGLIVALFFFLWLDLHFFARGREANFREAVLWSIGWLVLSLLAAIPVLL